MTIQDAIKSGRRFRRPKSTKNRYYYVELDFLKFFQGQCGDMHEHSGIAEYPTVEDLLATDWELEEDKIELSSDQIIKAIEFAGKNSTEEKGFKDNVLKFLGYK